MLRFQRWSPSTGSRAVVCLVHGHGDHSSRFTEGVGQLVMRGFSVCVVDLRGHGGSGGPRGDAPSYGALLDDIGLLLHAAQASFPGLPRFLVGHSLGGNLVLNYTLRRQPSLRGLVAISPWLDLAFRLPVWRMLAVRLVAAFWPSVPLSSRRRSVIGNQRDGDIDPLVHRVITPRVFYGATEAATWAMANASQLRTPLLVIHGSDDHSTSARASQQFVESVQGDVRFRLWQGLGHSIHGENIERPIFECMASWMSTRLDWVRVCRGERPLLD